MFAPYDYRRESVTQSDRAKLFATFINSAALFVLAYLTLYTVNQVITALVALSLDIKSVIYYHKIDFRISADQWSQERVIYTFLSGPITCLVLGIVFYRLYRVFKKRPGYLKLYFFWLYLHGCNLFFGAYVAGVITNSGFHWVTNYIPVPRKGEYVIAFFAVMVQFAIGYFSTKGFIQMAPAKNLTERFNRRNFILAVCVGPWLVGSAILVLFKIPNILPAETIVYLMMFTIAVPVVLIQRNFMEVNLVRRSKPLIISVLYLLVTLGGLLLFRSVFQFGLKVS
jgi:hypothetical protein